MATNSKNATKRATSPELGLGGLEYYTLHDYKRLLLRRKWTIISLTLATALIVSVAAYFYPDSYKAKTVVQVDPGKFLIQLRAAYGLPISGYHGVYSLDMEELDTVADDLIRSGMKLAAVDKRIENIFVITKLSLVFDVYPTEEQAIASFVERESV